MNGTHRPYVTLLVEDDPVNEALTTHLLTELGAEVRSAPLGEDLVQWVLAPAARPVDVVLVGLRLPDGDVRDVVRRLRHEEGTGRRVPVVVMTTTADPTVAAGCREAGCDAVLRKPVRLAALRATLGSLRVVSRYRDPLIRADAMANMLDQFGDIELVRRTVEPFLREGQPRSAALSAAVETQEIDRGELRRLAHSLKSTATLVGAEHLAASSRLLEDLAARGDERELRRLATEVAGLLQVTCDALEGALDSLL